MNINDELLTVREIIDGMRVSKPTVYRWIKTKGLPIVKIGKVIRIRREDFEKWIEERNEYKDAERSE